ncbi:MAG: OsmC family protein [Bacteroidales bacterium]
MATSEVVYLGNLRTKAKHFQSGTEIITDAPVDNYGKGEFFYPTDLAVTSFALCILTIMGIGAEESYSYSIDTIKVEVTKIMSTSPRRIAEIKALFYFRNIQYTTKHKEVHKQIVEICPVNLSLHLEIKKTINFNFNDESIIL